MYSLILLGKKLGELQKWRHLRFAVQNTSSFCNSFSSVSAAPLSPGVGRKGKNFTVSYLVESLGLTKKIAESISMRVSFEDKGNPDSVLNLLRSNGFTDSQISTIVRDYPQLLILDAEKSLGPKLQFLQSRGASSSELTEIVSKVPKILRMKVDKTMSAYYDFVKVMIEARKSSKFERLCHSVQNTFSFCNSFSSVSAAPLSPGVGRKGKNFTVSYLVESLGLTTKIAESISMRVSFEDKGNPDSILSVLRSNGFTDSQISTIVRDYPQLLILDAEKSLAPKLKFLQSRGGSISELTEIVSTVPEILGRKEGKIISRYYDFIKEIIEADKSSKFQKLCQSLPEGSKQNNKIRNVMVLRELGVPQKLLFSLLISDAQPVCGKENFEESLKKVVEMGFDPTTSKFVQALKVVYRFSDKTIEEKVNVCKGLGFSVGDVWEMFKKCPTFLNNSEKKIVQTFETLKKCGLLEDEVVSLLKKFPQCICASEQKLLNTIETFLGLGFSRDEFATIAKRFPQCLILSAESVTKKTEFVVKKMNWPLKAVVTTPAMFGYSLEKRTVPRCNVIKALMSKGLPGSELPKMSSVLVCTNEVFLNKYVRNHNDKELVPELMAIFTGVRVS